MQEYNLYEKIDDNLKEKAEILFNELGLNMSTAFNIFIRQSIRQGGISFEITTSRPLISESFVFPLLA